jgi:molecular chaperone DnaJ
MVASGVGPGGFTGAGGGFGPGFEGMSFDFGDGGGLGDILGGLFGGGGARRARGRQPHAAQRGHDLETELRLDFLDAVHGVETSVALTSDAPCSKCHGTGSEPGTVPERCATCGGNGSVAVDQGPFSFSQVCPTCGGRGQVVTSPCSTCRGAGVERRRRNVKVRIPAGVRDRQRIRIGGRGGAGRNGGPAGDLYVIVHVGSHPLFARSGARDLTITVPVTFSEAALGAQVKVPTLDAPVTVKVPPGTESGKTVRVRGRGIRPPKGDAGDLLVKFDVVVPKKLNAEQRAAVEALAEKLDDDPRSHLGV